MVTVSVPCTPSLVGRPQETHMVTSCISEDTDFLVVNTITSTPDRNFDI